MHASNRSLARLARPSIVLALVLSAVAGGTLQARAQSAAPSSVPAASAAPSASAAPDAMCESVGDLRVYVGFLRDQSISDDGVLPVLVGAVASLYEARTLLGLVDETYRPLVADLITSLQDLEAALRGFRDDGTIGSGLVQLGESIIGIGTAMEMLSVALSEPCPVAVPGASAMPAASASPAA